MSEEIKYEPVFGEQLLLSGAGDEHVAVCVNDYKVRRLIYLTQQELDAKSEVELHAIPVIAMRRIIKPPVWAKADQLAGKLPEVGAEVIRVDHEDEGCNVIGEVIATWHCAENNESSQTCLRLKDGTLFLVECYSELRPIETPAEKAQRERDEWIDNACSFICFYDIGRVDAIKSLEITYDKLKSGELPPVQAKDGA